MNSHYRQLRVFHLLVSVILIFTFLLSACNIFPQSPPDIEIDTFSETVENYQKAEVIFQVKLPSPIQNNEQLVLEILDDVTGVFFNPAHYQMEAQDQLNYNIRVPLVIGTKIKYRFLRKSSQQSLYEYNAKNEQIRYRVLLVNGPILVQDLVSAWQDQPYSGPVGRIRGQLQDQKTNAPIPNMAIYTAGIRTISASDGTFILENIPVGTHNVVISSLDGAYDDFQQGALIAEEATTPIFVSLKVRPSIEVTYELKLPDGFNSDLPLRLATNLYSLGFPDSDLGSGSSMTSANLPVFTKVDQNLYTLTLPLPAGTDFRYKFTLGDGFWNSELTNLGNFVTRELIVPSKNITIRKTIESFKSPGVGEITFNLATPASTPISDQVTLQLNPFGWMQPLPMIKTGENQWSYTLYTPTHLLGNIEYRFCRNDQCEKAVSEPIQDAIFTGTNSHQTLQVNVENWKNMDEAEDDSSVDTNGGSVQPRPGFIAGFELISDFPADWKNPIDQGLKSISATAANWVILTPTWTATSINPPLFEPVPGSDLLWPDIQLLMSKVTTAGMQPVIFPIIKDLMPQDQFWTNAKKDAGWWQTFFDRYHRFIIQNAELANLYKASAIMIGDPGMRPAMSNGLLADASTSSNPPENADEQWIQLIRDVRAKYYGPVIGVISLPGKNPTLPEWLKYVDGIYVLFSPSLDDSGDQSVQALRNSFDTALDALVKPVASEYNKPIIIGINYPATPSAINGCVAINQSCEQRTLNEQSSSTISIDLQTRIYNATIISSINRSWISGFISRGYDPMVVVKDQSSSIYGKPAADVLWFWYHFILNKPS